MGVENSFRTPPGPPADKAAVHEELIGDGACDAEIDFAAQILNRQIPLKPIIGIIAARLGVP